MTGRRSRYCADFGGPSAKLDVSGSGDIGAAQFIVDEFEKTGSGNLTVTAGGYIDTGGPPGIRLIE